jgi:putative ABC transport system permease protein
MSDLRLALAYLRHRILVTVLTIISVALGLGLAITVLTVAHQTRDTLGNEVSSVDVVIGGKGGPLQLVLNSLYYLDAPTGNISLDLWERMKKDPDVASVIPLNMGDNFLGSPIIGTVPEFFAGKKPRRGGELLAAGKIFTAPFETVVGADVARRQHLKLGDTFVGAHGWAKSNDFHTQFPYNVVGILATTGTSLDRGVFTDYRSVWIVHSHPDEDEKEEQAKSGHNPSKEVTALLLRLSQPSRRFLLVQDINLHENAMAVVPVDEISKLVSVFIAPLQGLLLAVAYLVIIVAALTILIGLYLTIHQRRRDIAITRALGATRADVFRQITVEAAALAGLGVICGWVLGHGLIALSASHVMSKFGIYPNAWQVHPVEVGIAASVWALGILAGLLPAAIAYRLPVADTLAKE